MRVLIAEDDPFFRRLLQQLLVPECEVSVAEDGAIAWTMMQQMEAPIMAVLDWVMPGMAGPQVCREARANPATASAYLILLTGKNSSEDILAGLRAGADDYVTKPFDPAELRARVRMGRRIVELRQELAAQERELSDALSRERVLRVRLTALEQGSGSGEMANSASA